MAEEIGTQIKQKEIFDTGQYFLFGAIVISLFLLLILGGWLLSVKNSSKRITGKIVEIDSQLTVLADLDEQATVFAGAVKNIEAALAKKQKWSNFFKELNVLTPKDIVYTNLAADDPSLIKIDGFAPTLSSIAKLLVSLEEGKNFSNVKLNSTSISGSRIIFSLNLTSNPSLLKGEK